MSLSTVNDIQKTVDYDHNGFSFIGTVNELIGNREYSIPCQDYIDGRDNAETFYWKALSAVGSELAETVYDNVRNYIQYVSDVDTCKVVSLRSMLQLFNYKCTVLDNFVKLPNEILKLLDILSIDKKYLKKAGMLKPEFIAELMDDKNILRQDQPVDFRHEFTNNVYQVKTDEQYSGSSCRAGQHQMTWPYDRFQVLSDLIPTYKIVDDDNTVSFGISAETVQNLVSRGYSEDIISKLSSLSHIQEDRDVKSNTYRSAIMYGNKKNYRIIDDFSTLRICDGQLSGIIKLPAETRIFQTDGDTVSVSLSSVYSSISANLTDPELSADINLEYDINWLSSNLSSVISVTLNNEAIRHDGIMFDTDQYFEYVKRIFTNILYGYITLPYNITATYMTHSKPVYVYSSLTPSEYFDSTVAYSNFTPVDFDTSDSFDNQILSVKLMNHISRQFDEKSICDKIDSGDDSLDNYTGAELSVLNIERERRAAPLAMNSVTNGTTQYTNTQFIVNRNKTRYSYYRKQKVLEYANFVDRYYSTLATCEPSVYDFDNGYWQLNSGTATQHVIRQTSTSFEDADPQRDIRDDMIETVANYLAMATQYICKLRHELKLQTQKNYMRGTNLLLIYIVNEYLRDYAKHNKRLSSDVLYEGLGCDPAMFDIKTKLENHQLQGSARNAYNINIQEYYDSTEYFNIKTKSTISANNPGQVNSRFWEQVGFEDAGIMQKDGDAFKLAEIEKFYLSSLNLERDISGNLPAFLSTIYDIGANDSFMYGDKNTKTAVFSSVLQNGQYASDIYERLKSVSAAYTEFRETYMSADGYKWQSVPVSEQIDDVLSNYIYPNLSSTYLVGLSDIHDKHIVALDSLSGEVGNLSAQFKQFTTVTYSCYYSKSDSKFCYDNNSNQYMFSYFNGNIDYDKPGAALYEQLFQLRTYSTEQNILNFPLRTAIDYVYEHTLDLSSRLKTSVISKLQSENGFVDINAATFDDQLQYTYNYVNDLIENRQQFLRQQLTNLQQQAQAMNLTYETLNNTFTMAIASYDDKNSEYSLGVDKIYWFSTYEDNDGVAARRSDHAPLKSEWHYVYYVPDEGCKCWYYGKDGERNGKYLMDFTDITPYNSSDSLAARCDAVLEYMNAPTSKTQNQYQYGLMNDGLLIVCHNTQAGLIELQTQFDSIASLAEQLFGIAIPSQTDIQNNIRELNENLTLIDESIFTNDDITNKYKRYFSSIVQLSAEYSPIKSEYDRIFTDKQQSQYLAEFSKQDGLTFSNIDELSSYVQKTDTKNYNAITAQLTKFIDEDFQHLLDVRNQLVSRIISDGIDSLPLFKDNQIESNINMIKLYLLDSIADRTYKAQFEIERHKNLLTNVSQTGYIDIMSAEISADLQSTKKFETCVKSKICELNFFDHDIYKKYKDMFLTYGGRDFCYDPYYNMKNTAHPSYQIHPYLWNFIKKIDGTTLIAAGFRASVVEDLLSENVHKFLTTHEGKFGQTVNMWDMSSGTVVDYSGYQSMYEKSANWSANLNCQHEVIDYEGAFYPPAVEYFKNYSVESVNSVRDMQTKMSIWAKCCNELTGNVHDYIRYDNNDKSIADSTQIVNKISTHIRKYVPGVKCSFQANIYNFLSKKVSKSDITWDVIYSLILDGIPETFYEKYYQQVRLTKNEAVRIADQLNEYRDRILDLTGSKPESEQYDIYKYGIDINKTHYILFKKYDYNGLEDKNKLSYTAKRDTLGQMWIRLGDHPIAFPAFAGSRPAYYIKDVSQISPAITKLADMDGSLIWVDADRRLISRIDGDMEYFYDFEIACNKASIAYIAFDPTYSKSKRFFKQFRLAMVAVARVTTYQDKANDILYLRFYNDKDNTVETSADYIEFNDAVAVTEYKPTVNMRDRDALAAGMYFPALIGYHVFDNNSINFIYMTQYFKYDDVTDIGEVYVNPDMSSVPISIFAVQVSNGTRYKLLGQQNGSPIMLNGAGFGGRLIVGDSTCVGYDRDREVLTFAFITERPALVQTETAQNRFDLDAASDGALINDPLAPEMNSYDILGQNVTLVEMAYSAKGLKQSSAVYDYNMNADMSYIPVYPGYSNEFDMAARYGIVDEQSGNIVLKDEYHNIELLGKSKDISPFVALVNPDPDPYFDYEKMRENVEFSRVYEDYIKEYDKTFTCFSNPSISFNSSGNPSSGMTISTFPGRFVWRIDINGFHPLKFTEHDLHNMDIIIYNSGTMGKNPYYVGKLRNFVNAFKLDYNAPVTDENDAETVTTLHVDAGKVSVTGTHRDMRTHNIKDSNYIKNVKSIQCETANDSDTTYLMFTFELDQDDAMYQYTKVPEGEITIVLYNNNDIDIYQYYHMLDAYGAVQCKYYQSLVDIDSEPDDGRGWGIYRPNAHDDLSALTHSFFTDKSGLKTYLDQISLSSYDSLSDIYVFRGNKMLSFKNEEQYRFPLSSDLYYYPTLNISYPKQAANYVESSMSFQTASAADMDVMQDIFDKDNLFVINLENPGVIADKIGTVDIPVIYNDVYDIRVYEDYLDYAEVPDEPGLSAYNYELYDIGDSRIARFVKFTDENATAQPLTDDNCVVPNEAWQHVGFNAMTDSMPGRLSSFVPLKSEEIAEGIETEYITVNASSATCDISRFLKFYVNYCRNPEGKGLDLYFNYFNYLDSPYVKYENSVQLKTDTIRSTYLKLEPGTDGIIDIIVQFKYYVGQTLYGYKNVRVLSYRIYNISDDKPKFLMYKTYEIQPGHAKRQLAPANASVTASDIVIDLSELTESQLNSRLTGTIYLSLNADKKISSCDFYLDYPNQVMEISTTSPAGYQFMSDGADGICHIKITNTNRRYYTIPFTTKQVGRMLLTQTGISYQMSIEDISVKDADGYACDVEPTDSVIRFETSTQTVLAAGKQDETVPSNIKVYSANSKTQTINIVPKLSI